MSDLNEMKELAIKEAKKLKKHATKEEVDNLNLDNLDTRHVDRCIYGQMTGYCFSDRAHELILKCAPKVYATVLRGFDHMPTNLNGKPTPVKGSNRKYRYFSPIETLILQDNGNDYAAAIMSFLKGETKTLTL